MPVNCHLPSGKSNLRKTIDGTISHDEKEKTAETIAFMLNEFFPQFAKEIYGKDISGQNKELLKEWFMHASVAAPFFNWRLFFPEIDVVGGFDIVIGNPPYGGTKIDDDIKNSLGLESKDIYGAFIARFLSSGDVPLKAGGVLAYIVSDTFMTIKSHKSLRKQMMNHFLHKMIRVHPDTFKATVNTAIIICERNSGKGTQIPDVHHCQMVDMTNISIHENYERFVEVLHRTEGFASRKNEANGEYAIYYYSQSLINTNSNIPFFVASPKLFAFMNDSGPELKIEWIEIRGNRIPFRAININGKDIKVVKLEQVAEAKVGLQTGDNPSYLFQNPEARGTYRSIEDFRELLLSEDDLEKIRSNEILRLDVIEKGITKNDKRSNRYFEGRYIVPYDKGGESDADEGWMPNYYVPTNYYIDWSEWAVNRMRTLTSRERNRLNGVTGGNDRLCSRFQNSETYFKAGITFSRTGYYAPTFRYSAYTVYDTKAPIIFITFQIENDNIFGILCSKLMKFIIKNYIGHTVDTQVDEIKEASIILNYNNEESISNLVKKIIEKQKKDPRYDYAPNEQLEIDRLIYEAYGLNDEDIQEVENWYARRYPKLVQVGQNN